MRTVVLIASTLALAVLAWAGSVDHRLVTAPKGTIYADALIGPLMLDVEIISGTRCFMAEALAATDPSPHGVIWPYGTTGVGDSLLVPGLTNPLRNGDTFWAGGGSGGDEGDPALGVCDTGSAYYLGPTASRTDPKLAPAPGSS